MKSSKRQVTSTNSDMIQKKNFKIRLKTQIMSIFLVPLLFPLITRAFEPPPDFCGSISGLCQNHSFCSKTVLLEEPKKTYPRKFEYDSFIKKDFVESLNKIRNEFACGSPPFTNIIGESFPKAAHMQAVVWDEELEWGAEQYASQCTTKADSNCAVTPNYRNVGFISLDAKDATFRVQHIAMLSDFYSNLYDPYVLIDMETIRNYNSEFLHPMDKDSDNIDEMKPFLEEVGGEIPSSRYVENFKIVIHDRVSKIGCSTYVCNENHGSFKYVTACIVDNKNIVGKPIYKGSNVAASDCEQLHRENTCLCAAFTPDPDITTEANPRQTAPIPERITPLNCERVLELTARPRIRPTRPARRLIRVQTKKTACIKRPRKSEAMHLASCLITYIVFLTF